MWRQTAGGKRCAFLQICTTVHFTHFLGFIARTACALLDETLLSDHANKINLPILNWLQKPSNSASATLNHTRRCTYELPFD